MQMLTLEDLASRFGTDKGHDDHKYTDLYGVLFEPLRWQVRSILEVGVSSGQSIAMCHE